jgi:hypothetical protein
LYSRLFKYIPSSGAPPWPSSSSDTTLPCSRRSCYSIKSNQNNLCYQIKGYVRHRPRRIGSAPLNSSNLSPATYTSPISSSYSIASGTYSEPCTLSTAVEHSRILSTISARTDNFSTSQPISHAFPPSPITLRPTNPTPDALRRSAKPRFSISPFLFIHQPRYSIASRSLCWRLDRVLSGQNRRCRRWAFENRLCAWRLSFSESLLVSKPFWARYGLRLQWSNRHIH